MTRIDADTFEADYFANQYRGYDAHTPARKVSSYVDFVRSHVSRGPILEIGCAYGVYAAALSEHFDVVAHDVSVHAITEAERRFSRRGVRFVSGPPDDTTLGTETFGAIVAFDVLEHIPDIDVAMRGLLARLEPRGTLVLSVPVYDGPLGWLVRALDRDPTHVHKWARADWYRLLDRYGLEVVGRTGLFRYALPFTYLFMEHPRLRRVGPAILVAARRRA